METKTTHEDRKWDYFIETTMKKSPTSDMFI